MFKGCRLSRYQGIVQGIGNANLAKKAGFQAEQMLLSVPSSKNVPWENMSCSSAVETRTENAKRAGMEHTVQC